MSKTTSKTILITGASSGFGRDTAETLARAGHNVFASMRDVDGKHRDQANELRKQGIAVVELDVSNDTSVDAAVREVLAYAGRIDVLVNNAGIASAGVTEAFTAEQALHHVKLEPERLADRGGDILDRADRQCAQRILSTGGVRGATSEDFAVATQKPGEGDRSQSKWQGQFLAGNHRRGVAGRYVDQHSLA